MPKDKDGNEIPPTTPEAVPPKEKVIAPDWGKRIDELTAKFEALAAERAPISEKQSVLEKELADLKAAAPTKEIKSVIKKAFTPWTLFFGK